MRGLFSFVALFGVLALFATCSRCHTGGYQGGEGYGQKKMELKPPPEGAGKRPVGLPALTVRSGPEPFTRQDVVDYFKTHNLPKNATTTTDFAVESLEFITSKEVTARLDGVTTGLADADRVGFVTLRGTFVFTGPKTSSGRFGRAYAVFDAGSGNLLMIGSLSSEVRKPNG